MSRLFVFKTDGIGDFFLASGAVRCLANRYGEENLTVSVLPPLEPVVRGQFPKAEVIALPIRKKRVILNVFAANCLRCFRPFLRLIRLPAERSVSLRNMRDYLMNVLYYAVPARHRVVVENQLLGNGRPVRRWTERAFLAWFRPEVLPYPDLQPGVPSELAAHRAAVSAVLGREVTLADIWPQLRPVGPSPIGGRYRVCAPFANGGGKDFPTERWVSLFVEFHRRGEWVRLLLTGSREQSPMLEGFVAAVRAAIPGIGEEIGIHIPHDLQAFVDFLASAELVLTVDTAAAHAATALDRPTLILFSGQSRGIFAPWVRSERQRWLEADGGSSPEQAGWHAGIRDEKILATIGELLTIPG